MVKWLSYAGIVVRPLVRPDTLLHWHRQGYRLVWRAKSATAAKRPQVAPETVALIKRMAEENRLWGAERIRGEFLKLGVRVGKRTVQQGAAVAVRYATLPADGPSGGFFNESGPVPW